MKRLEKDALASQPPPPLHLRPLPSRPWPSLGLDRSPRLDEPHCANCRRPRGMVHADEAAGPDRRGLVRAANRVRGERAEEGGR